MMASEGGNGGVAWTAQDRMFMLAALEQAQCALDEGEVPVGCVIARDGDIVAHGSNKTNETRNGTRHAEFIAIDKLLGEHGGDQQAAAFHRCTLYVTCEPCIMCAGALSLMAFGHVVYGCANDKFGGNGSIVPVHDLACGRCAGVGSERDDAGDAAYSTPGPPAGQTYGSRGGLLAEQAIKLLQAFYTAGNPNAPRPHRPVQSRRAAAQASAVPDAS